MIPFWQIIGFVGFLVGFVVCLVLVCLVVIVAWREIVNAWWGA